MLNLERPLPAGRRDPAHRWEACRQGPSLRKSLPSGGGRQRSRGDPPSVLNKTANRHARSHWRPGASPPPKPPAIYPYLRRARRCGDGDLGCGWLFGLYGCQTADVRMKQRHEPGPPMCSATCASWGERPIAGERASTGKRACCCPSGGGGQARRAIFGGSPSYPPELHRHGPETLMSIRQMSRPSGS